MPTNPRRVLNGPTVATALSRAVEALRAHSDNFDGSDPKAIALGLTRPFREAFPELCWTTHEEPPYVRCRN